MNKQVPCPQCGFPMENKCMSKCENCGFYFPCGSEPPFVTKEISTIE